jgi:hypothetical protein
MTSSDPTDVPEEVRLFARSAAFGLAIATVYWFVSYDVVGTVLLLGFGLAGVYLAGILALELRASGRRVDRRPWRWLGLTSSDDVGDLQEDPGRLPSATVAPLLCGLGLSIAALTVVYGPAMLVAGIPLMLAGGSSWLRSAAAEHRAGINRQ